MNHLNARTIKMMDTIAMAKTTISTRQKNTERRSQGDPKEDDKKCVTHFEDLFEHSISLGSELRMPVVFA